MKHIFAKPMKKCFQVGTNMIVAIDNSIVEELEINEDDTFLEQEIVDDGILMHIHRIGSDTSK